MDIFGNMLPHHYQAIAEERARQIEAGRWLRQQGRLGKAAADAATTTVPDAAPTPGPRRTVPQEG